MNHLNAELPAAQKKLNRLQSEFESETKRLLAERQASLYLVVKESEEALEELRSEQFILKDSIVKLIGQKEDLLVELSNGESVLTNTQELLSELKTNVESEKTNLSNLKSEQIGVQSSVDALKAQIAPLREDKASLTVDIEDLYKQKVELIDFIELKNKEFEALKEVSERDLSILKEQKSAIIRQNIEAQTILKAEREDLAIRKQTADKRDNNLKIREMKVSQGEQSIEANANLLNL